METKINKVISTCEEIESKLEKILIYFENQTSININENVNLILLYEERA